MTKHVYTTDDKKVTLTLHPSLLCSQGDATPTLRQRIQRGLQVACIVWLLLFVLFGSIGLPYVRWDKPLADSKDGAVLDESNRAFTRYIGLDGARRVYADEYGEGLPGLIFISIWDEDEPDKHGHDAFIPQHVDTAP